MKALEGEIEDELDKRREELHLRLVNRRITFEQEVLRHHRQLRARLGRYVFGTRVPVLLVAPVIYSLVVPLLLDLMASLYQAICFPVYGIPRVRRSDFLLFDRGSLAYLNAVEKLNCAYCSYGNGLIAYVREIGARTEQYWCPIKHAQRIKSAHSRYARFLDYGDADA
jgi:hypothetical protein